MARRPVPAWVVLAIGCLLVATASVMSLLAVVLAADGPFNLVRLIADGEVFAPAARYFGSIFRQGPMLLALEGGVTDTQTLTILLGVGYLVLPSAVWALAVVLSRSRYEALVAVALAAGLTAAATWFCSVSESLLAVALTALLSVLLWRPDSWNAALAALACATSIVLVASYETAVVTGLVLAVWSAARARRATSRTDGLASAFVALASLASMVVALSGSFSGQNDSNSQSFAYAVVSLDPPAIYLALGALAIVAGAAGLANGTLRTSLMGAGLLVAVIALATFEATPASAYNARGAAIIAVVALQLYLVLLWWRSAHVRRERQEAAVRLTSYELAVPVVVVAAACAANLVALREWTRSFDAFRAAVAATDGQRPVAEALAPDERRVVWGWTASSLSLVVRSTPADGVLVDARPSFVPFPPAEARDQIGDEFVWRDHLSPGARAAGMNLGLGGASTRGRMPR